MTRDIGIIGLGVMGKNLALNMVDNGFQVALFDLWEEARKNIGEDPDFQSANLNIYADLESFVSDIKPPRAILLMVKAGETVDHHIDLLLPLLSEGDIIIDGGNSQYRDSERRAAKLADVGLDFVGLGVSGGEIGARHGPSLMAGASPKAYTRIEPIFSAIAAKAELDDETCFTRLGTGGAGHLVKTVHNGIEYADMQLIAEVVSFLRTAGGCSADETGNILRQWNEGPLASYLIEISSSLLMKEDADTGGALVDVILDMAGQKGTGRWTAEAAIEYGVAAPSLIEAVMARGMSAMKDVRVKAADRCVLPVNEITKSEMGQWLPKIESAILLCKFAIYAQGLNVIEAAAKEYDWQIDLNATARVWRAGCIIRAELLNDIASAYKDDDQLENLLLGPNVVSQVKDRIRDLREVASLMVVSGIAAPVLLSTLSYIEGLFTANGSANIIQAQRDYFGAHTYKRTDKDGDFHTVWEA